MNKVMDTIGAGARYIGGRIAVHGFNIAKLGTIAILSGFAVKTSKLLVLKEGETLKSEINFIKTGIVKLKMSDKTFTLDLIWRDQISKLPKINKIRFRKLVKDDVETILLTIGLMKIDIVDVLKTARSNKSSTIKLPDYAIPEAALSLGGKKIKRIVGKAIAGHGANIAVLGIIAVVSGFALKLSKEIVTGETNEIAMDYKASARIIREICSKEEI